MGHWEKIYDNEINKTEKLKKGNIKLILRIILSPLILLWGVFILFALTLIPIIPGIIIFGILGFITEPFIYLFQLEGTYIKGVDPFFPTKYTMLSHFLGITVYIWGAPAIAINYIITGEIWNGDE
jgi:hypothetical protein